MSSRRRGGLVPRGLLTPLRFLGRYWGYVLLGVLVLRAVGGEATSVLIYALGTLLVLGYSLFGAPMVCGALNRGKAQEKPTYCRNNSRGLLLGCNQVRAHKTQKLSSAWWASHLRRDGLRDLWRSPGAVIASVSGLMGMWTGFYGLVRWALAL